MYIVYVFIVFGIVVQYIQLQYHIIIYHIIVHRNVIYHNMNWYIYIYEMVVLTTSTIQHIIYYIMLWHSLICSPFTNAVQSDIVLHRTIFSTAWHGIPWYNMVCFSIRQLTIYHTMLCLTVTYYNVQQCNTA